MRVQSLTKIAFVALCWLPLLTRADVFINEIHYDNVGADVGESVEVVATAGEDLTQYRIVLYNGGNNLQYDDDTLPAGQLATCGAQVRFGRISYPQDGLQNGANDGVALVGPGNSVIQFLSYEGVLTPTDGPAAGMTSTDIGVAEPSTTPVGQSLQLTGSGTSYTHFTWLAPATSTFGACNNGQTFGAAVDNPPQVVSSVPAEGASGVAVAAAITLTFNEPIAMAAGGVALSCNATAQPLTISGSGSSRTLTPDSALPFSSPCTLTIAAAAVTDLDGNLDPLENPFALNFQTAVDNAPTLLSSVPVNNAPAFPANGNLQLAFSEPVNLGATWFQIACSLSGTRVVSDTTISGGPSTYSIDPSFDFDQTETCTLTLDAAQITDLDGVAQTLNGANTVAFTVAAPVVNDPPVVLATTPMNGDSNFPAAGNLTALFSEQVNLLSNAFTLSCAQSGSVALTYPASGMSFSISTGTALIGGESCTFTIVADRVSDAEGAKLAANVVVAFTVSVGGVGSYYDRVNTSSPAQLRCSLNSIIKGHTTYPYTASTTDTWDILNMADEDPVDSSKILDVYRNESYTKITGGTGIYNREHTWPNTYGFSGGNPGPYTDTHMLHLTNTQYNSDRGSKPFANCDTGCSERPTTANHGFGGGGGGDSNYVLDVGSENNDSFEVWDHIKGNMARAMMYMAIRYEGESGEPDLELTDTRSLITSAGVGGKHYMGLLTTLLQWHQLDPVDARELDRNEIIFNFQSNRNPFVDHPEWGTLALLQSSNPTTCVLGSGPLIFADGFGN